MTHKDKASTVRRREFLVGTAAVTACMIRPSLVQGSEANSTIELGMIGCGGRGNWIAKLFLQHAKYRFVASSDYFQDRVDAFGNRFQVPAESRYTTLSGYKRVLEKKVDAVVIETPPYAHPEQAAAAVDAGKHVFLAKPIAVDAPGCLTIAAAGKKATANKQVFLVDFQTRADPLYLEAVKRVHRGDIGPLVCGEAQYPWSHGGRMAPPTSPEERLRRWYFSKELSGDFIVEQAIHTLDVATWFANADPISACGAGGRTVRPEGSIWDHFTVTYRFPGQFTLAFTCVQTIPGVPDEIHCRIYGGDGVADSDYFDHVWIRGKKPYEGGKLENLYTSGAVTNIVDFYRLVTEGHYANETVAASVRSNLTCVLGREAAYAGRLMTWDELIKANVRYDPELTGLKT